MTPAAITPAGRTTAKRAKPTAGPRTAPPRSAASRPAAQRAPAGRTAAPPTPTRFVNPASAPSAPGHRRRLRPKAAPKVSRRVSGPVPGRSAGITLPRPGPGGGIALPRPGRGGIIKPRPRPARPATRRRTRAQPLPRRVLGFVRVLPDHPLLDRVVRGRAWIAVLGVMLAGIVAMQVEVLKLGASIGRSVQRGTALQSRNEQLRATVAELADDQRIEQLAAAMGMVMPAPDGVGFVSVGPGTLQKAIANIHPPNTQAFLALSAGNGAVTGASTASGAPAGTVPAAGPTPITASAGTTSPSASTATGTTGASTQTPGTSQAAAPGTVTPTQAATQPSSGAAQTTSYSSPGGAGAAALAPTQSSPPTGGTGGAGVPAAG